jgi:ABC-type glutathione transport system ATPase component
VAEAAVPLERAAAVLEVRDLVVAYRTPWERVVAVDHVDLELRPGEVLGIVGESGSGKTTMATALLGLTRPPANVERGQVLFEGRDILRLGHASVRKLRWEELAFIPQGAMSALNPVVRVGGQFADVMRAHGTRNRAEIRRRTAELLASVDLDPATARLHPHELSGGMKQRVCIAMAIALGPKVVVADEPTSALDVVVQRSVMETLRAVQASQGLSVVLIGHDMALQAQVVGRLAVMARGRVVEVGDVKEVFSRPAHPYTQLLLSSVPSLRQQRWDPSDSSPEKRRQAYGLIGAGHSLRPVGPDHEAAVP